MKGARSVIRLVGLYLRGEKAASSATTNLQAGAILDEQVSKGSFQQIITRNGTTAVLRELAEEKESLTYDDRNDQRKTVDDKTKQERRNASNT